MALRRPGRETGTQLVLRPRLKATEEGITNIEYRITNIEAGSYFDVRNSPFDIRYSIHSSLRQMASAICEVPTAVGSSRCGFMS